jgi:hypothetical protein
MKTPGAGESCGKRKQGEERRSLKKRKTLETQRNRGSRVTEIAGTILWI